MGIELYKDILKAKNHLANKWDDNVEQFFLDSLNSLMDQKILSDSASESSKYVYQRLLQIAKSTYAEVKNKKTSYKGLQYAPDLVYPKLLDECFTLTEFHLYREVFETMVLASRALWPIE